MIFLIKKTEAIGKVSNIGTGKDWTIEETASLIMKIYGRKINIISENKRLRPKKSEVNKLVADNRLLKEITDWKPKVSFNQGLKNTLIYFNYQKIK